MIMKNRREVMMMTKNKEYRNIIFRAADDAKDGALTVEGYAAVFNQRTLLFDSDFSGWKYYEEIAPEAFRNTDMSDVILRYNHSDAALILARTSNNTLRLSTDSKGLKVSADINPTTAGQDMYKLIKRGDVTGMSFAFTVRKSSWTEDQDAKESVRRIEDIDVLYDVAPVDFPAYDGTSITARSRDECLEEIKEMEKRRSLRKRLLLKTYL